MELGSILFSAVQDATKVFIAHHLLVTLGVGVCHLRRRSHDRWRHDEIWLSWVFVMAAFRHSNNPWVGAARALVADACITNER